MLKHSLVCGNMSLFDAVKENKFKIIQRLLMLDLSAQNNFDRVNEHGENVFMIAAKAGSVRTFQLLVEIARLSIDRSKCAVNINGSLDDNEEEVKLPNELLNRQDKQGKTVVHHAISSLSMPILSRLVKMGAYLDVQDKKGNTPMHLAAQYADSLETIKLLIRSKAAKNIRNTAGFNPVDIALIAEQFSLNLEHTRQYQSIVKLLKGASEAKSEDEQGKQSKADFKSSLYSFGRLGQNVFHALAWISLPSGPSGEGDQTQLLKRYGLTKAGVSELERVYQFISQDRPSVLGKMMNKQVSLRVHKRTT